MVFGCASDGWAFSLETFAHLYAKKLNFNPSVLRKTLWGDYYINVKEKKILKGAYAKGKKPLFVQLVLDNIWALYQTVLVDKDKAKLEKMVSTLGLKVSARDMKSADLKQLLQAVMSNWLPLAIAVLTKVIDSKKKTRKYKNSWCVPFCVHLKILTLRNFWYRLILNDKFSYLLLRCVKNFPPPPVLERTDPRS